MEDRLNPFHELYVTESIGSDAFVRLYSDKLVSHTTALFKPGNVILKGLPGTGKSMMLNLLKPSVRIAYKQSNVPFPVPTKLSKFIGAGINLIRSSVSDFGQRSISVKGEDSNNELAIYFGDFLNYFVVRDIIQSIQELNASLSKELSINLTEKSINKFIKIIRSDDCWFSYLKGITTLEDLDEKLRTRLNTYRSYLNFNIDNIPVEISTTKTNIGIPISAAANALRESGIIGNDVNIFIRIDQYEELTWIDQRVSGLGTTYQSVIHKLLAMRDKSVSYRIGTRPFAWSDEKQEIIGTAARLEQMRNYISISIDDVLRRPENKRAYIFPEFAEDIFFKRLSESKYLINYKNKSVLKEVFGSGYTPTEKAQKYVSGNKERAIELDAEWPKNWRNFLIKLANEDPLSARLGEAWARQKGKEEIVNDAPKKKPFPWDNKKYWVKERTEQALIQIASRNRQQLIWEGKDDILNLSGGNILAFLSLCQQIWEVWLRDKSSSTKPEKNHPVIDEAIQTLGILEASFKWFENISKETGGKERKNFITLVGTELYKELTQDLKMSYPGKNGFSITIEDLQKNAGINKFLMDAASYGDLYDRPHTTKTKDGKKRIKFYLNPILSPYFKLPSTHTKEPKYISINDLEDWMVRSGVIEEGKTFQKNKKRTPDNKNQGSLF